MPNQLSGPELADGGGGPALALLIRRGGASGGEARYPIRTPEASVGRAAGNTVMLDDPTVAAEHARIRLDGGVWWFEDRGSVQGSAIDGEPAGAPMPLAPGSSLRLGELQLAFDPRDRWEDSPAPASALPTVGGMLPTGGSPSLPLWAITLLGAVTLVAILLVRGG